MNCRHCNSPLQLRFVYLSSAPPSNAYLTESSLQEPELWFPPRVPVCTQCWLVQAEDYARVAQIFTKDYAYFSLYFNGWLKHAQHIVSMVADRFQLNRNSQVVELAANAGYLLQFLKARHIPCIRVEPTARAASRARAKELEIVQDFFGLRLAKAMSEQGLRADLVVANNVLAHVPDINDFVAGVATLLTDSGVATFEFPHLLNLVTNIQVHTIYHEYYSCLSLTRFVEKPKATAAGLAAASLHSNRVFSST